MSGPASYLLGVDLGTSGCKAVALAVEAHVVAMAEAGYPMAVPRPGWAEQDPDRWWQSLQTAVSTLVAQLPAGSVPLGVAVTGQMHSLVALDGDLEVIRPSILWCDRRSVTQAADIEREVGPAEILRVTRNPSRAAFTASKLRWLVEHEPASAERLRHVLLPKDWVVLQLTGELSTEASDASGTGLFDVTVGDWSADLLTALHLDAGMLPTVRPSAAVVGRLLPEAADRLGLPAGLPVIAGAGDQAAAAFDAGATTSGVVACNLGTSIALTESVPQPVEGALSHVVPDQWLYLTSAHSGTIALDWWSRVTGGKAGDVVDRAATSGPGARGVRFVPRLMGSRDGGANATAASFRGLREDHTGGDLARAVLEGLALEIRYIASGLPDLDGAGRSWRIFGGGARGPLFVQTVADVLDTTLDVIPGASSAGGAARLLAVGLGVDLPPVSAGAGAVVPDPRFDYTPLYDDYCAAVDAHGRSREEES